MEASADHRLDFRPVHVGGRWLSRLLAILVCFEGVLPRTLALDRRLHTDRAIFPRSDLVADHAPERVDQGAGAPKESNPLSGPDEWPLQVVGVGWSDQRQTYRGHSSGPDRGLLS